MIRLEEIEARYTERMPELAGRIGHAGEFSRLMEKGQLPQLSPYAFILFGGINGGRADASSGLFRQGIVETVNIVLVVRSAGDPLKNKAVDEATPLVRKSIEALAGWGPDGAPGVLVLRRAALVGSAQGVLLFQIDFELDDQLRIER
jgi:hypothetical protein